MFTLINFSHRLDIKKGCIHFDTIWYILRPQCCYFGHHSAGEALTERAVKSFLAKFGRQAAYRHRPDHTKAKPCTIVKEGGAGYREQNIFVAACKAHLFPL